MVLGDTSFSDAPDLKTTPEESAEESSETSGGKCGSAEESSETSGGKCGVLIT